MKKAMFTGILASFFFAFTFIFNRSMNLSGGFWMWSAVLRYLFTLPILYIILLIKPGRQVRPVMESIRKNPAGWIIWSTVGFGLFYLPLTLASLYGESWFTAASWQLTIVIGVLLTPLFGKKIPVRNILTSIIILIGVALLQAPNIAQGNIKASLFSLVPILIAAVSYPLGNRKMMEIASSDIDAIQRTFGMTLCSMPFWILSGIAALIFGGLPNGGQILQSLIVAVFSGIFATILFFRATDMVRNEPKKLALVEATQSGEVIFTLLGGILVLGDSLPGALGFIGIGLIVLGMILGSLVSK